MTPGVLLTEDAEHDLEELYDYIAMHDAPEKADHVITRIAKTFNSLTESPDRGVHPKELLLAFFLAQTKDHDAFSSRSATQTLMIDWRGTPRRFASLSK